MTCFSVALGADDVPAPKPHPDGLFQLCKKLNVDPVRCIYVGDSPTDGQAATAAGMQSIGVTWGSHPTSTIVPTFTHTANSLDELYTLLEDFMTYSS